MPTELRAGSSGSARKKILMVSHGHPEINPGGGEVAAHNLFKEIRKTEEFDSVFFARHDVEDRVHGGTTFSGTGAENEILFYAPVADWFKFSQPDKPKVWRDFRESLELSKPDIVHFHHYVHLGLELIREVKNYNPDLPVILTLHEYFAICHNHGQMVKTTNNSLCHKSSPVECAKCFPEKSAQDFFLRKQFIQSYFELVDHFISPSEFLRQRYIEWGLPAEKIQVIENVDLTPVAKDKPAQRDNSPGDDRIRFSFFGQINWFKGIDVLINSLNYLPKHMRKKIVIDINGSGLENQPREIREHVNNSIAASKGVIRFRGRYQPAELAGLMSATDYVVIPSKWWENSPMVILEANKYGVPVICSNIGGMAEKVEHGTTGLHFQAGRADSLADQMLWVLKNPEALNKFKKNINKQSDPQKAFDQHRLVYRRAVEAKVALPNLKAA